MKRFAAAVLMICLLCAGLFLIYSFEIKPVESLMVPPEYSDEGGSVQAALEAEIGKAYYLKTPTRGEYQSAFIYYDLDGDNKKEAVVLYSNLKSPDSVNICVFQQDSSSWKRIAGISAPYRDVVQLDFGDTDANGISEIIVGYGSYSSEIVQHLFVYSVDTSVEADSSVGIRYECDYSQYCVLDADGDDQCDLLVLNSNDNNQSYGYTAEIVRFSLQKSGAEDPILLDTALRIVSDIAFDYAENGGCARIYVDGYTSDGKMLTDMMVWDKAENNLARKILGSKSVASLTMRTKAAICEDINNDGLIDIPTDLILPASKATDAYSDKNISLLRYICIEKDKPRDTGCYFENTGNGYYYKIDKSSLKNLTIVTSRKASYVKFYTVKEDENGNTVADRLIFEIRTVTDLETGRAPETFKSLGQNKEFYYYCRIYEKGEQAGLTVSDIRKNLIFDLKGSSS